MEVVLLILTILAAFGGGFFIMGRLDVFLKRSFRSEPPEYQPVVPSCMMLNDQLSDEELIGSIRQFASSHKQISIILRAEPAPAAPEGGAAGNNA